MIKMTDIERIACENGMAFINDFSDGIRWYGRSIPDHDPVGFAEGIAEFVAEQRDEKLIDELRDVGRELWDIWYELVQEHGSVAHTKYIKVYEAWKAITKITTKS